MSSPSSLKATSLPTTPCNLKPSAFHHVSSHVNLTPKAGPASTLPPHIGKNISETCKELLKRPLAEQQLDGLIKIGESSLEGKDYIGAIRSLTEYIKLASEEENFRVYCLRAEAHYNQGNFDEAIEDCKVARKLNVKCSQAYHLQGKSQSAIGMYNDSMAVLAFGLSQEPSNEYLLETLVDSALHSDFKQEFEIKYETLKSRDLHKVPYIVVATIGQELLIMNQFDYAAIILESSLKMGVDNKRYLGSILSTISNAFWNLKNHDKAMSYMQKELEVESELADVNGQCRVLANMGYAHYKMRNFDSSLESHRKQVNLAMRNRMFQIASTGLNAIGHIHMARGDFIGALTSHTGCLKILEQMGDNYFIQFKELLSIGHVNTMRGDFKAADESYKDALELLERNLTPEEQQTGHTLLNFNLAYLALRKRNVMNPSGTLNHHQQ